MTVTLTQAWWLGNQGNKDITSLSPILLSSIQYFFGGRRVESEFKAYLHIQHIYIHTLYLYLHLTLLFIFLLYYEFRRWVRSLTSIQKLGRIDSADKSDTPDYGDTNNDNNTNIQ